MSVTDVSAAMLLRVEERLRQERETFDQRRDQEERWFTLRLRMGYVAALLLPALAIACAVIIFEHDEFDGFVVNAASATLFADVLGLIIAVWKVVFSRRSITQLEPITAADVPIVPDS